MATRRVTVNTRVSRASTSTPVGGASTSGRLGGATSPTSPTRTTRLQEKEELQHLNDRLACYIDRMRHLENENARLTQEVHMAQETVNRETSNLKAVYEKELAAARKLLDETAKEKAKLEIDIKRLWEENDDLKQRLDKKIKEANVAENNARLYESRYTEVNGKYNQALADRKKAEDQVNELSLENERLRRQLDDLRKQLEAETLARVDLENQNQSLREELAFKDQVHSQELTETRSRRQIEINEIDGRLSRQYEAKLQQSLQELRDQYEAQMRANREEVELLYDTEIQNLKAAANRAAQGSLHASEEVRMMRTKIDGLNNKLQELENTNANLNARIRELENQLDSERLRHNQYIASLEADLQRMRDEMTQQLQEYKDLMDIKVSLDLELAAYDKLLCGEERRLNITSPGRPGTDSGISSNGTNLTASGGSRSGRVTPSGRRSATPGISGSSAVKRRRTVIDESEDRTLSEYSVNAAAKGDLEIIEADTEGRFIKLHNKGTEEINLTGWQLTRIAGDEELAFKFSRGSKVSGGASVTIWSADTGASHDPPNNLLMKKKWPVANSMRSILTNADKEVRVVSLYNMCGTCDPCSNCKQLEFVLDQMLPATIVSVRTLPAISPGIEAAARPPPDLPSVPELGPLA
ncbi:PREDICTED: lamin-C isoform X1 [Drosophila arizonae]|uniref:Lamin-C isoform X1 n=1 Tax=Drosophila arizonae TaxID=7263 RepID=A0ABM1PFX2_DROAR|nr:PREDICTED: lamin-C isoform X1 [Drosophila arizonae]